MKTSRLVCWTWCAGESKEPVLKSSPVKRANFTGQNTGKRQSCWPEVRGPLGQGKTSVPNDFVYFFVISYLFGSPRYREGDTERSSIQLVYSPDGCNNHHGARPKPGVRSQVVQVSREVGRAPRTCSIYHCFPQDIRENPDQKWNSLVTNQCPYGTLPLQKVTEPTMLQQWPPNFY